MRLAAACCLLPVALALVPAAAPAQEDRAVRLHAPDSLRDTGLFRYILPRFTLKTQVRVALVDDPAQADLVLGADGVPLFARRGDAQTGAVWSLAERGNHGARCGTGCCPISGRTPSRPSRPRAPRCSARRPRWPRTPPPMIVAGDAALGREKSREHCIRCHAIDADSHMTAIANSPSFMVLKTLPDWQERFLAFYVLRPHPAFTQIAGVTAPFPQDRPPALVPVEMTLEEVDAILAYVAGVPAADLGAPILHQ